MFPLDDDTLIEYTDNADRPLLVAPWSEARRIGLICRIAGVILRDAQKRVCIRRRKEENTGRRLWDVTAVTPVHLGESREDAAYRVLAAELGIHDVILTPFAVFMPNELGEPVHFSLFSARISLESPDPVRMGEHLFLDEDELNGLAGQMPEMLTTVLRQIIHTGNLWNGVRKRKACPDNGPVPPVSARRLAKQWSEAPDQQ